jgi:hypothetical protein
MQMDFDIRPMVERISAVPIARLRVLRSFDEVQLPAMRRGIIFVFAAWSGPAVTGFQRFTKVIQELDTSSLDLVVLDTDCLTEDSAAELFGVPSFTSGGWGEAIWIQDGRVIARAISNNAPESMIEQNTKELLDHKTA